MDRFSWSNGILISEEQLLVQQNGVRIYDGEQKTAFDHGRLMLTSHQFIWKDTKSQNCTLSLSHMCVILVEEEPATLTKSSKIVVHVGPPHPEKPPGPVASSSNNFIRFSFTEGGQKEVYRFVKEALQRKKWEMKSLPFPTAVAAQKQIRSGIAGIERNIVQKHEAVDKNISLAFEDLSRLMEKAKEMVTISKSISTKIKEKQGDITEDETTRFKAYLLSLGIDDPVTRETHGNGDTYLRELAKQISDVMEQPLKECGGIMTLTDVYCRINRARGMELLSPGDLVNACQLMERLNLPVRFRVFESGVIVLQLLSHSEEVVVKETLKLVEDSGSLTPQELSKIIGLSVIIAKERLLIVENRGKLCRDESPEGLRFYPNLFLTRC